MSTADAYARIEHSVSSSSRNLAAATRALSESLKALLPPDEPALLRPAGDGPLPRRPERTGVPLAVTNALRDLAEAQHPPKLPPSGGEDGEGAPKSRLPQRAKTQPSLHQLVR